jgi:hypothetical protein
MTTAQPPRSRSQKPERERRRRNRHLGLAVDRAMRELALGVAGPRRAG